MSKLVIAPVVGTFKGLFRVGAFFARGYVLKKERGARFSSKREQRKLLNNSNKGFLIDGKNKRVSEKDSFNHIAIIAKPGAGKTTGFIIPNILDKSNQNCSMLITDPSGEIYEKTSQQLKNKGFDVVLLNPGEINISARFNPFDGLGIKDITTIEQICCSIVLSKYGNDKEPVWNEGAISLLEIFAKCLVYSQPDYLNVPNLNYLIQMFGEDGRNLDYWIADNSINPNDIKDKSIIYAWKGITSSNPNMLSSYATIVKTALKQLNNRQIQKLLGTNDIDLKKLRKKKTAIFLSIPENEQEYYQFIIDMFYARFFSSVMANRPNKKDLSIYCFLDEFGNAYVDNFKTIINNLRKYRVALALVLQGVAQFSEKYGRETAKAIKSGVGAYLVYAGADYETAQEQSNIIGKKILIERDELEKVADRYTQIDLLSAGEIRTLKENQALFMSGREHPFIVDIQPYYKNSGFNRMSKKGAFVMPENTSPKIFKQLYL